jgi:MFS family permease
MTPSHRFAARSGPPRIFYGWYIVLAGALNNFFVIGITIFGFGVFYEPMRAELGWSMTAIMAGVSVRSFQNGFLAPVAGTLVDRFGPRTMALVGITVLTAGLLLYSQAHELWVYYLASVIIAVGQSLGSISAYSLALMNWFHKKRGRVLGLLNSGNAVGFFSVGILGALITVVGWRATLIIAAAAIFVFGIPLALVLRDRPEPYGFAPDGEPLGKAVQDDVSGGAAPEPAVQATPVEQLGMTVSQTLRTPAFYMLALANAAAGAGLNAWVSLQVAHLQNGGFSLQLIGVLSAVYGVLQVVLRIAGGWAGDLLGRRQLYRTGFLFQAVGLIAFANTTADRAWLLPIYYVAFAFGHAVQASVGQTVTADYFGTRRFATIMGMNQLLTLPVGVLSPIFAGWLFDHTGSYAPAFMAYGVTAATGILWLLLIRRPEWSVVVQRTASSGAGAAMAEVQDTAMHT